MKTEILVSAAEYCRTVNQRTVQNTQLCGTLNQYQDPVPFGLTERTRQRPCLMTDNTRTLTRARIATSMTFGLQGFLLAAILTQLPQYKDLFELSETLVVVAVVTVSVIAGLGSVLAEMLAVRTSTKMTLRTAPAVNPVFAGDTGHQ